MQESMTLVSKKRSRSPDAADQDELKHDAKRRATTVPRPTLQVDCTVAPPRPTPEMLYLPTYSPYRAISSTSQTNVWNCSISWEQPYQNLIAQPDWIETTQTIMSATNLPQLGFLESCNTSADLSSSLSSFPSISAMSNLQNPFELSAVRRTTAPGPQAIDTAISTLQEVRRSLSKQIAMVEKTLQALQEF
jgi:hypothetical protein